MERGALRADDLKSARHFLETQELRVKHLSLYRGRFPWFSCLIFSLMSLILLSAWIFSAGIGVRNFISYQKLSREGLRTQGVMERPVPEHGGGFLHPYRYQDAQGQIYRGYIKENGALFSRADYFSRRQLGVVPPQGSALEITYLKTAPSRHVPFPLSRSSIYRPLFQAGVMVLIISTVLFLLLLAWLHTLKNRRETTGLSRFGEPGETFRFQLFPSYYYPVDPPQTVTVLVDGVPQSRTLIGKLERLGWQDYAHFLACLAAYYLPSLLLFSLLPARQLTFLGHFIPPWQLALVLSIPVFPVTAVLLALKRKPALVIAGAVVCVFINLWWLKTLGTQNPQNNFYYPVLEKNFGVIIPAWGLSLAAMLLTERWQKLKDWLDLERPVYREDEEE